MNWVGAAYCSRKAVRPIHANYISYLSHRHKDTRNYLLNVYHKQKEAGVGIVTETASQQGEMLLPSSVVVKLITAVSVFLQWQRLAPDVSNNKLLGNNLLLQRYR